MTGCNHSQSPVITTGQRVATSIDQARRCYASSPVKLHGTRLAAHGDKTLKERKKWGSAILGRCAAAHLPLRSSRWSVQLVGTATTEIQSMQSMQPLAVDLTFSAGRGAFRVLRVTTPAA